jgi:hypothetical protein
MQKQTTPTRTRPLRIHAKMSRRSVHRHLAVAVVAVLLAGVGALSRNAVGPGPGEPP